MQKYINTVTNYSGDRVAGAVATVTNLDGSPAVLYSDAAGLVPIGHQVTTDDHGQFSFYAAIGRYNIAVSGLGITPYSITDVAINGINYTASVKDFGAVGDGVIDDTSAIQAAITYAINNNKYLYLPDGNYSCDLLTVPHAAQFNFTGPGHIIKRTSDGTNLLEINKNGAGYMIANISGITFTGIAVNTPSVVYLESIVRSALDKLTISSGIIGLRLAGGIINSITRSIISGNSIGVSIKALPGAYLGGWPNNNTISGRTVISDNTLIGIDFDDGRVLVVDGCDIENNGTSGNLVTGGIIVGPNIGAEDLPTVLTSPGLIVSGGTWFESNSGQACIHSKSGKLSVSNSYFVANPNAVNDIYIEGGKYLLLENDHDTNKTVNVNEGAGVLYDNAIIHCDIHTTNSDYTKTTQITSKAIIGDLYLGDYGNSESLRIRKIANAVNRIDIYGNSTGNGPVIQAEGSDANVNMVISPKGAGGQIQFYTDSVNKRQLTITNTVGSVNFANITGSVTGSPIDISAQGSDANIGIELRTKGTGDVLASTFKRAYTDVNAAAVTVGKFTHLKNIYAAGTTTLTLPDPTLCQGREISIMNTQAQLVISATANVIPQAGGAATTSILAATVGKWCYLVSSGVYWQIMMSN
ncbi:MAG: glycosyl hydrolase family 28-related protein [Candidatus Paceibacterota bacterium]